MIVAVMIVGVAMVMPTAAKADCSISMTLKQGMRNTEVSCLQAKLAVTPATGYFGTITKAAVMAYQANHDLKADGVVGPLTRATLATQVIVTPGDKDLCPNGMTLASNCTVLPGGVVVPPALCPNGMTLASNCTVLPGTVTPGNTDGSITAGQSSYVSSGITLKKGDTKDVVALKLQATGGPVKLSRLNVNFNLRPWLYFSQVVLHDSAGTVLATKTLSSIADVTEISAGSNYQIGFDNLNYTVTPGTNVDLAVKVSVLSTTDKITQNQVVYATIPSNGIRTINEIGWTDSTGGTDTSSIGTWAASTTGLTALSATGDNSFLLASTGSVADIYSRISPNSPAAGQQVVSTTQTTSDITLGVFSLKTANNNATLNTFAVGVTYTGTPALASAFSNYRLFGPGCTTGCGGSLATTTLTFSNLTAPLTQDNWTDFTIKADAASGITSGATVKLVLTPSTSTIVVTDVNYGTPTVETGSTPTSNTLTLTTNAVTLSNASATLGTAISQNNYQVGYNAKYDLTLTNGSNNDLYVSSTPASFVAMSTTTTGGLSGVGSALGGLVLSPSTLNGDITGYYIIPSGSSRSFNFDGSAIYAGSTGTSGGVTYYAGTITYTTSTGVSLGTITTNLSPLSLTAHF